MSSIILDPFLKLKKMKCHSILLQLLATILLMSCNSKPSDKIAYQTATKESNFVQEKEETQSKTSLHDTTQKVATPTTDFNIFKGSWLRMDGNYELRITEVSANGTAKAAYFNPNPINVESAKWEFTNNYLYVLVKLQDVNYPGSTYTLQYFPEVDKLGGVYFQAVEGTNYDVIFERKK